MKFQWWQSATPLTLQWMPWSGSAVGPTQTGRIIRFGAIGWVADSTSALPGPAKSAGLAGVGEMMCLGAVHCTASSVLGVPTVSTQASPPPLLL